MSNKMINKTNTVELAEETKNTKKTTAKKQTVGTKKAATTKPEKATPKKQKVEQTKEIAKMKKAFSEMKQAFEDYDKSIIDRLINLKITTFNLNKIVTVLEENKNNLKSNIHSIEITFDKRTKKVPAKMKAVKAKSVRTKNATESKKIKSELEDKLDSLKSLSGDKKLSEAKKILMQVETFSESYPKSEVAKKLVKRAKYIITRTQKSLQSEPAKETPKAKKTSARKQATNL